MNPGTVAGLVGPFAPDNYVFLCFFTDPATEAPHCVQGTIEEVVVS
jgi:hypothetical protein